MPVCGIDTNVLVRYLTQDDPEQARRANRYIDRVLAAGDNCLVNTIVLCETVWVLSSAYRFPKTEIIRALELLVAARGFALEQRELVRAALQDYSTTGADFSDCLIGRLNAQLG